MLNLDPPAAHIINIHPKWYMLDIDMSDPSEDEIRKSIKQLKNNKAAGYDATPGEMLQSGEKKLEEWLTRICIIVWNNDKNAPEAWKKGVIIRRYKI